MRLIVVAALMLFAMASHLTAGDAFGVGWREDGTSTTSKVFSSQKYYVDAETASMKVASTLVKAKCTKIYLVTSSDKTGLATIVFGLPASGNNPEYAAGYGATKEEADQQAFQKAKEKGIVRNVKILTQYVSQGSLWDHLNGGKKKAAR